MTYQHMFAGDELRGYLLCTTWYLVRAQRQRAAAVPRRIGRRHPWSTSTVRQKTISYMEAEGKAERRKGGSARCVLVALPLRAATSLCSAQLQYRTQALNLSREPTALVGLYRTATDVMLRSAITDHPTQPWSSSDGTIGGTTRWTSSTIKIHNKGTRNIQIEVRHNTQIEPKEFLGAHLLPQSHTGPQAPLHSASLSERAGKHPQPSPIPYPFLAFSDNSHCREGRPDQPRA